jgi:hypothetical protein
VSITTCEPVETSGPDQLDAAADAVAHLDIEEHTVRMEVLCMLDDVLRARSGARLDMPGPLGERHLQARGDQCVLVDDEHAGRLRPAAVRSYDIVWSCHRRLSRTHSRIPLRSCALVIGAGGH